MNEHPTVIIDAPTAQLSRAAIDGSDKTTVINRRALAAHRPAAHSQPPDTHQVLLSCAIIVVGFVGAWLIAVFIIDFGSFMANLVAGLVLIALCFGLVQESPRFRVFNRKLNLGQRFVNTCVPPLLALAPAVFFDIVIMTLIELRPFG